MPPIFFLDPAFITLSQAVEFVASVRKDGWRPAFPDDITLSHYGFTRLIEKCWNQKASNRPTASKALVKLHKILPQQIFAKHSVKDGDDRIKLMVRGEGFIARRSVLARVRRSHLWELFAGGRVNDHASNEEGYIELDADPAEFEKVLAVLQLLDVATENLASLAESFQNWAAPVRK